MQAEGSLLGIRPEAALSDLSVWYKPNASCSFLFKKWHCEELTLVAMNSVLPSDFALREALRKKKKKEGVEKRPTLTCDRFCANRRGDTSRISEFEVGVWRYYRLEMVVILFICHFHCLLSSGSDFWKQCEAQSWQKALEGGRGWCAFN